MAGYLKSLLDDDGIECFIKNQFLTGGRGDLPLNECWPELWITDDDLYSRAMTILSTATPGPDRAIMPGWQCECGEQLEGQFETCWNCGSTRPE